MRDEKTHLAIHGENRFDLNEWLRKAIIHKTASKIYDEIVENEKEKVKNESKGDSKNVERKQF